MAVLSFSRVLTILVFAYIIYSMSSFYKIFYLDECTKNENCIYPMFNNEIEYQIIITGQNKHSRSEETLLQIENAKLNSSLIKILSFNVPQSVKRNKSYTIHSTLTPVIDGKKLYEHSNKISIQLTKLHVPIATTYNLLNNNNDSTNQIKGDIPEMHLYNKIVITTLSEPIIFHYHGIPQELYQLLKVNRNVDGKLVYQPIVYLNTFVLSADDVIKVSDPLTKTVNISIEIMPVSMGKMRLWRLIEHATQDLGKFGFNEKSIDSVRGIFTNTNFYLLVITFSVAALHLLFDILSFKNDISFWRSARTTEGLSGRTVMWRCLSSVIIFFYLVEENTSLLVLVPFGVSTVIEFWKLSRVLKVRITLSGPRIEAKDSGEQKTDQFDSQGMNYLMWLIVPLCIGGSIYSLFYLPHKSWYSWTVNTLANGVYVFGFLFMTPQLFINYKLKSVAHLPWKALTYKAFNTFIDDFFAFIITMPTSHRLACFRDDIVFVIYIYQRWLYPVDKSRVNEFGESFTKLSSTDDSTKKNE